MPPMLLLLRIGVVPLPLPLVLLWPIAGLVWAGVWIAALTVGRSPRNSPGTGHVLAGLALLASLRGLRLDVTPREGPHIHMILL
ncbi:MAG: hypothetical protein JSV80_07030 [Acidobacteriota bacterium]|nr:MAG: hypothetical protein JSV80_07030 [Acidobacteriota bacterium]